MSPDDPRHGSNAGYRAHQDAGTEPCQPCRDGAARYERGRMWDRMRGVQRRIPILSTRRRLQALGAIGWTAADIAAETGLTRHAVHDIRGRAARLWVSQATAQVIADVYDQLCMTVGPSEITRQRARDYGWLPPLAWDDIDADSGPVVHVGHVRNPDEVDEAVVIRILAGEFNLRANLAEKAEVVRRWRGSRSELERMTGWNVHRYTKGVAA